MTDELILDNLVPHVNLKELSISGFSGARMPPWFAKRSMENITILEFKGFKYLEQLPVLEILTLVKLELEDLPSLTTIGQVLDVSVDERPELFLPPYLQSLIVIQCKKLGELPQLPPSLVRLQVHEVGLTKLPRTENRCHGNASAMSPKQLKIEVVGCQNLVSLEGSFFEQKQYMGILHSIYIRDCVQLEYPPLPFEEMNRLEHAVIRKCPQLRALSGAKENLLPPSVRQLNIEKCGDLELPLLKSLQCLTNLTFLTQNHCSNLATLPSASVCHKNLKSLRELQISGCDNLISLGGLGSLPFLGTLVIFECSNLVEAAWSSQTGYASVAEEEHVVDLQVSTLHIDLPSLLLVQPLKSLHHTRALIIGDASKMKGLPEQWLLQNCMSLLDLQISKAELFLLSMKHMSVLENLVLWGTAELKSLPDLPLSLRGLQIFKCHPDLEKKIRVSGSPERCRIPMSHECK